MSAFKNDNSNKTYQAYELTEFNSLFHQFFDDTFVESGFLWSSQDLTEFYCIKAETTCPITVFPILEIGSLKSAEVIAKVSVEYYNAEYFLASPLTCSIKGYKVEENIFTDRYPILPHGSIVDFDRQRDETNTKYIWTLCSWVVQVLIYAFAKTIKLFRKTRKNDYTYPNSLKLN